MSLSDYVAKVQALATELSEHGEKQSDKAVVAKLLHGLPERFRNFKRAWDSTHPD